MWPTLGVAIGGALGSVGRYWVGLALARWSRHMPWSTVFINITGSFAIALFAIVTAGSGRFPASATTRLFLMAGLCGGYTTFSSFSLQTYDLLRGDAPVRALLNVVLSVGLCLAATAAGALCGEALNRVGR